ncbi:MAG TPA: phosphatase PAP2 family protein, partial [Solirubrobacteraceae bacterium]|nr:phosphatase PAP2 family protein [Solirubrobacteraceae bacterium]
MLRSPRVALSAAATCVAAFAALVALLRLVPAVHARDMLAAAGFRALGGPRADALMAAIAHLANPVPYVLAGGLLAVVALARARPRSAAAIAVLLPATGATTEILKHTLGQASVSAGAFPSGHATASMTLALCAVLAAPPRARPLVAVLGAAFAVAVSTSVVALDWHSPIDIVGGFLVAAAWTAGMLGALLRLEHGPAAAAPARGGTPELAAAGVAAVAGVLTAGAALAVRTGDLPAAAFAHATAAGAAGTIAALALGLAAAT